MHFLTLIFFSENLPLKGDELVMSEMLKNGGGVTNFVLERTCPKEHLNLTKLGFVSEEGHNGCKSQNIAIRAFKVAPYSFWTARELISKISRWRELSIPTLKSRAESRSKMLTNMASKFLKFVYR